MQVRCKLYPGLTHTGPLIEGPMAGGKDDIVEDILSLALREERSSQALLTWPMMPYPQLTTWLAGAVCPF